MVVFHFKVRLGKPKDGKKTTKCNPKQVFSNWNCTKDTQPDSTTPLTAAANGNSRLAGLTASGLENFRSAVDMAIQRHGQAVEEHISKVHYLDRIFRYVVVISYSLFCIVYFWYYAT